MFSLRFKSIDFSVIERVGVVINWFKLTKINVLLILSESEQLDEGRTSWINVGFRPADYHSYCHRLQFHQLRNSNWGFQTETDFDKISIWGETILIQSLGVTFFVLRPINNLTGRGDALRLHKEFHVFPKFSTFVIEVLNQFFLLNFLFFFNLLIGNLLVVFLKLRLGVLLKRIQKTELKMKNPLIIQ
jgi:hypothetical protein